jgi:acyl-CoA thioester hydrolase
MEFYHFLPVQIRFNDADPAQHVNNAVYQEYFDLGRVSYFKKVIGSSIDFAGISMVIASFKVDFFLPVFLEDQISVETKISLIGTKSLEMTQQIVRVGDSSPCAVSTSVLVCYNYRDHVTEVIPSEWKLKINQFEHSGHNGE